MTHRGKRRTLLGPRDLLRALALTAVLLPSSLAPPPPLPRLEASLGAFVSRELWNPRGGPLPPSAFHYRELTRMLEEARREMLHHRFDAALLRYGEALARFPGHPAALAALTRYYFETRDRPRFRAGLRGLRLAEPGYPGLHLLEAEWALSQGETREAGRLLGELVHAGQPVQDRARLLLAELAYRQGNADEVRELVASLEPERLQGPGERAALRRLRQAVGLAPSP